MFRKFIDLFTPTAFEMAARELAEARLSALREQTMAEYAAAQAVSHQAMVEFNQKRVARLSAYLQDQARNDDRFSNAFGV